MSKRHGKSPWSIVRDTLPSTEKVGMPRLMVAQSKLGNNAAIAAHGLDTRISWSNESHGIHEIVRRDWKKKACWKSPWLDSQVYVYYGPFVFHSHNGARSRLAEENMRFSLKSCQPDRKGGIFPKRN